MTLHLILIQFLFPALLLMASALFFALAINGIERKIIARMQSRTGPPLTQPFIDLKKLFIKENIVPGTATPWLFNAMPFIALASSLLIFLYLPFMGSEPLLQHYGDIILVLYALMIPSLALAIGAFASGSSFAAIGAQREIVLMASYEFVLAIIIVTLAWLAALCCPAQNAFSFAVFSSNPAWLETGIIGLTGLAMLFISSLLVMPAKAGKLPIDAGEAKTELAEGALAEYSGKNLAMLYLSQALRGLALATLITALFIPFNISPFLNLSGVSAHAIDALFFLFKVFTIMLFSIILLSAVTARMRIDQASKYYLSIILLISLTGLFLTGLDFIWSAFQ